MLPDAFLTTEALLWTFQNILEGLVVVREAVDSNVTWDIPFLALEQVIMELTLTGASRQVQ